MPSNIFHPRSAYLAWALSRAGLLNGKIEEGRSSKVVQGHNEYAFSLVIRFITHAVFDTIDDQHHDRHEGGSKRFERKMTRFLIKGRLLDRNAICIVVSCWKAKTLTA